MIQARSMAATGVLVNLQSEHASKHQVCVCVCIYACFTVEAQTAP